MTDDNLLDDTDDGSSLQRDATRRGVLILIFAALSGAVIWLLDRLIPGGFATDGYGTGGYGTGGFGE